VPTLASGSGQNKDPALLIRLSRIRRHALRVDRACWFKPLYP
jgi:hypothetical protein